MQLILYELFDFLNYLNLKKKKTPPQNKKHKLKTLKKNSTTQHTYTHQKTKKQNKKTPTSISHLKYNQ